MNVDLVDRGGVCLPPGHVVIEGRAGRQLVGLHLASKDLFEGVGNPTGADLSIIRGSTSHDPGAR